MTKTYAATRSVTFLRALTPVFVRVRLVLDVAMPPKVHHNRFPGRQVSAVHSAVTCAATLLIAGRSVCQSDKSRFAAVLATVAEDF